MAELSGTVILQSDSSPVEGADVLALSNTVLTDTFTVTVATDLFTSTTAGHGLVNGNVLRFTGAALPAPLVINKDYFVVEAAADTFKVSEDKGGAVLAITTEGTPPHTFTAKVWSVAGSSISLPTTGNYAIKTGTDDGPFSMHCEKDLATPLVSTGKAGIVSSSDVPARFTDTLRVWLKADTTDAWTTTFIDPNTFVDIAPSLSPGTLTSAQTTEAQRPRLDTVNNRLEFRTPFAGTNITYGGLIVPASFDTSTTSAKYTIGFKIPYTDTDGGRTFDNGNFGGSLEVYRDGGGNRNHRFRVAGEQVAFYDGATLHGAEANNAYHWFVIRVDREAATCDVKMGHEFVDAGSPGVALDVTNFVITATSTTFNANAIGYRPSNTQWSATKISEVVMIQEYVSRQDFEDLYDYLAVAP